MRAMVSMLKSADPDMWYRLPFNTWRTQSLGGDASTTNTYNYSIAVEMLRDCLFASQLTAGVNSQAYYSVSALPFHYDTTDANIQIDVGALHVPPYGHYISAMDVHRLNQISAGAHGEVLTQVGLQNANNYALDAEAGGMSYIHFNLDNLIGLREPEYIGGLNTGRVGGHVTLQATSSANAPTVMAVFEFTRVFEFGGGQLRVNG